MNTRYGQCLGIWAKEMRLRRWTRGFLVSENEMEDHVVRVARVGAYRAWEGARPPLGVDRGAIANVMEVW